MKDLNNFILEKLKLNKQSKLYNNLIQVIWDAFSFEEKDNVQRLQDDLEKWMNEYNIDDGDIYMYEKTWDLITKHTKGVDINNYIVGRDKLEKAVRPFENELNENKDNIGRKFIVLYGPNVFYFEYLNGFKLEDIHSILIVKK